MNVIRCKNGHFFDGDTYEKCPHCGEDALLKNKPSEVSKEKKTFWGKEKKDVTDSNVCDNTTNIDTPTEAMGGICSPNSFNNLDTPTEAVYINNAVDFNDNDKQDEIISESVNQDLQSECNGSDSEKTSSLRDAIKKASASSEGKTLSYFSSAIENNYNKIQQKRSADPIVGWIVCISGVYFGESFSICAGKNSIGRSSVNSIVLSDDNSISRIKHALIVYEPKKRNFYLQPGDSSGLTYLNDDYITESCKLSFRDVIELGNSKFLFVPLCGDEFSWEEYTK